ncbi:MAG: hypothetical protein GX130_05285 [Candidatus Hydrogenedens sp.]|nr:hypothetical protein [Candidatus Hydrogenedens sp.]
MMKKTATLAATWRGKTKKGTPYLALGWKLDTGEGITQYLYLTDKARPYADRALKTLAMTEADIPEMKAYTWTDVIEFPPPIRATLSIVEEEYQGRRSLKVKNAQLIEGDSHNA